MEQLQELQDLLQVVVAIRRRTVEIEGLITAGRVGADKCVERALTDRLVNAYNTVVLAAEQGRLAREAVQIQKAAEAEDAAIAAAADSTTKGVSP